MVVKNPASIIMADVKNILITGLPAAGKTTLVSKLRDELKGLSVAGFFTAEIREKGLRKGFRLVSLDGRESVLSYVDFRSPFSVGKYRVDVRAFEEFLDFIDLEGSRALVIVIDEIGKMECLSEKFKQMMSRLLDSQKIVVATIALKGAGFISQIKHRPDIQLFEITNDNRDSLVLDILSRLEKVFDQTKKKWRFEEGAG